MLRVREDKGRLPGLQPWVSNNPSNLLNHIARIGEPANDCDQPEGRVVEPLEKLILMDPELRRFNGGDRELPSQSVFHCSFQKSRESQSRYARVPRAPGRRF